MVIDRPADLSGDAASSESALTHAIETLRAVHGLSFERIVFLQATSPLRREGEVDAAVSLFEAEKADSLVSVCASHDFLWTSRPGSSLGEPVNYDPLRRPRRQDMAPQFRENGSLYVFSASGYERHRCRLFGRIALHEMPAMMSLQIDSPEDWIMLEAVAGAHRAAQASPDFERVKLVVFDFDGVMSDNRVLVMQDGTEGALCNRSVVGARCRKLGLECHQGIDDKITRLRELVASRGLTMADVAYVGNDINDLACMREVGLPIAVADAYPPVLAVAKMITSKPGGCGAVREVCDALIAAR
jgi:N-acylneuraminate cytidylyltransferase